MDKPPTNPDEFKLKERQNKRDELNDFFSRWDIDKARGEIEKAGITGMSLTLNPLLTVINRGLRKADVLPEENRSLYTANLRIARSGTIYLETQPLDHFDEDFGELTSVRKYRRDANGNWWGVGDNAGFHLEKDQVLDLLLDYGFDRERLRKRFSDVIEKAGKAEA